MNTVFSSREKAIASNTLICLLHDIVGLTTTVELRNETVISGVVVGVDIAMNVSMRDVTYTDCREKSTELEVFYIRGKNIRYIQIPDEIDVVKALNRRFGPKKKGAPAKIKKRENRFGIITNALLKQQAQNSASSSSAAASAATAGAASTSSTN